MINLENFSEWFHNILEEANIIDSRYPIKGMSVWLPYGYQIRKYMLNVYRDLLDKDHEEVLFPLLIPEAELAKEGKLVWINSNLGDEIPVVFSYSFQKWEEADDKSILIDDRENNINDWIDKGKGIGILHKSAEETIEKLKGLVGIN